MGSPTCRCRDDWTEDDPAWIEACRREEAIRDLLARKPGGGNTIFSDFAPCNDGRLIGTGVTGWPENNPNARRRKPSRDGFGPYLIRLCLSWVLIVLSHPRFDWRRRSCQPMRNNNKHHLAAPATAVETQQLQRLLDRSYEKAELRPFGSSQPDQGVCDALR